MSDFAPTFGCLFLHTPINMDRKATKELEAIVTVPPAITVDNRHGILPQGKSMDDYLGHTVINLSDIDLTAAQVSALSKGLTFCPTPWEPDMSDIILNLEKVPTLNKHTVQYVMYNVKPGT